VKEKFEKIDRGTLLKGSAAAAVLSMLAGTTAEAKNKCCEPGNFGFGYASNRSNFKARKGLENFKTVHGVWLKTGNPGAAVPAAPAGYKPAYFIPGATGAGYDSNNSMNSTTNKDTYVFVKL